MGEEVCIYQKFGFCKFKDTCKNKHLKETCKDLGACVNSKICQKRHPRGAKGTYLKDFAGLGLDVATTTGINQHSCHKTIWK